MTTVQAQKKVLRKTMTVILRSLSASDIHEQSQMITSRVLSSSFFQRSKNVSCYLNMPTGEVDTSALVSEILRAGKTLFVPRIDTSGDGRMHFLKVYEDADLRSFSSGLWGIREPGLEYQGEKRSNVFDETTEQLDLILVPGVAFDRSLSRLGHGKGYYDRFINAYTSPGTGGTRKKPLLVALALREQVLEAGQVPTAAHDWKMDVIVSPDGIIGVEEAAR
ncbi:5-formyltetrahydrofolate cyclo-ligase [Obba rivulosa]|uniref:5-formyltetrahydrofolate cyclo-ligase n=1 Tax=Obba rivulosa TaxID=1052685 RepID=A0A8E2DHN8_9APHY|nr:5-formyltetrahydrofolate cyclo-ligase [Obba rivulosa]